MSWLFASGKLNSESKESAWSCSRHGFVLWSGKIPLAVEQLSLWTTTNEPALWSPGGTTTEPVSYNCWSPHPGVSALQQERPSQGEAATREKPVQRRRHSTVKNKGTKLQKHPKNSKWNKTDNYWLKTERYIFFRNCNTQGIYMRLWIYFIITSWKWWIDYSKLTKVILNMIGQINLIFWINVFWI